MLQDEVSCTFFYIHENLCVYIIHIYSIHRIDKCILAQKIRFARKNYYIAWIIPPSVPFQNQTKTDFSAVHHLYFIYRNQALSDQNVNVKMSATNPPSAAEALSALAGPLSLTSLLDIGPEGQGGCPCCAMRAQPLPHGDDVFVSPVPPNSLHMSIIEQAIANAAARRAARGDESSSSSSDSESSDQDSPVTEAQPTVERPSSMPTYFQLVYLPTTCPVDCVMAGALLPTAGNIIAACPYTISSTAFDFATCIDATEAWLSQMESRYKMLNVFEFPPLFVASLIKGKSDSSLMAFALHDPAEVFQTSSLF